MLTRLRSWASDRRYFYKVLWGKEGEYELRLLSKLVDRRRVAVDAGANQGIYSFHMSRFAPRVEAFEPNPIYWERLLRLGHKVKLHKVALSDRAGTARLNIPKGMGRPAEGWGTLENTKLELDRSLEVAMRTLDSYSLDIGFLKIDVEGHENTLLQGALETIKKSRPNILVECEDQHRANATSELFALFSKLNYRGFFFVKGQALPVENFELARHQVAFGLKPGQHMARQEMDYVNNFVFVPFENPIVATFAKSGL